MKKIKVEGVNLRGQKESAIVTFAQYEIITLLRAGRGTIRRDTKLLNRRAATEFFYIEDKKADSLLINKMIESELLIPLTTTNEGLGQWTAYYELPQWLKTANL